jgi:hypothetical protein
MRRFLQLKSDFARLDVQLPIQERQQRHTEAFNALLRQSKLLYWEPDAMLPQGRFILIGVMDVSRYDLELLDVIHDRLCGSGEHAQVTVGAVELFGFDNVDTVLPHLFPGQGTEVTPIVVTPVIGWWVDGEPIALLQGYHARKAILDEFGLEDFVRPRQHEQPNEQDSRPPRE